MLTLGLTTPVLLPPPVSLSENTTALTLVAAVNRVLPHLPADEGMSRAIEPELIVKHIDLIRIALVGAAAAASRLFPWRPFEGFEVVALTATLLGGYPIFHEAFSALLKRRMTMELSMSIAILAALAIGECFTALVIVLFVLVAEVLEGMTVERGRRAIRELLDVLPRTVNVRQGEGVREVPGGSVRIGDVVLLKPGARVPVDGVVSAGHSFVDQSAITGESLPVEKVPGSSVFTGTVNQSGWIEVRTTGTGQDTAFAKILHAVEEAERSRAPIQKTADRLSGYLVYFALGAAALTFVATRDLRSTISVVIVAGACGVAAGTPLAILGAIGRAARQGAIIKGGRYLEALFHVDTVVLDKTGTLTFGDQEVVRLRPCPGITPESLLGTCALAERPSDHPIAKAVLKKAREVSVSQDYPEGFEYRPGEGIACTCRGEMILVGNRKLLSGHGVDLSGLDDDLGHQVLVAQAGRLLGSLEVADVIRPEAGKAVQALRRMGLKTMLLSGDGAAIAREVGIQTGVDEVHAEVLPEGKLELVKSLQASGKKVAMVGDGINDAPALMQADAGIAMGSGTDVARESAGIVLLGNDLLKLVETLKLARRCRRTITQNFVGTVLVTCLVTV
jgi:heavy metal translocating P-type ATPase